MPQISIIKKSDIQEAHRFDAEFFKPELLKIRIQLEKNNSQNLINFLNGNPQYGTTPQDGIFEKTGVNFIRSQDFQNNFIDDIKQFCSEKFSIKNKKSDVIFGDILLAVVGATIGDCAIYLKDEKANINQNVARLRIRQEKLNKYFLIVFLKSIYAQSQILGLNTGNAQSYLNTEKVNEIKIPILPQSFQLQIEKIVKSAYEKQTQSKQLYKEAEELFLQELNLVDYKTEHTLTFNTFKKEIDKAERIDAEYYQPRYEEIIDKIEKYNAGFDFIKNQFNQNTILSKKNKGFYNYIEISDINISNGAISPHKIEISSIPANGKRKLFKDDLLISKVRPYRGAVSFIYFEIENLLGSGAFTVLQEKTDYKKEVLMIFLKTFFIKDLLLRYNCGTSYPVIKDEDILNLKIPLIKLSIQKQIVDKIQESYKLEKESKNLLEEAKRKVEEEIERRANK